MVGWKHYSSQQANNKYLLWPGLWRKWGPWPEQKPEPFFSSLIRKTSLRRWYVRWVRMEEKGLSNCQTRERPLGKGCYVQHPTHTPTPYPPPLPRQEGAGYVQGINIGEWGFSDERLWDKSSLRRVQDVWGAWNYSKSSGEMKVFKTGQQLNVC